MELQKDKEFQQEVETKNIDPESGLEIVLDLSSIASLGVDKQTSPKHSEIEETEELFHSGLLDFAVEEEPIDLNFETEDLLPESIVQDEIIKLLEEEISFVEEPTCSKP